jgi:hypothetical protein
LGLTAAISALAVFGLSVGTVKLAHAEFQIQEATIEKGETEFEYRGAYHCAGGHREQRECQRPRSEPRVRAGARLHQLVAHAVYSWDQPLHEDFNLSDVEIESEFGLIKRKGDGIALSFQVGYEQAINHGEEKEASTIGFCPLSNSPAESC